MNQCENFLQQEKRKALFRAYKEARNILYEQKAPPQSIHTRAIRMAVQTKQPRFWMSPYRVYRFLQETVNRKKPVVTYGTRKSLYNDLLTAYNNIKDKRMFKGKPLIFVAQYVAYEPSAGFYISHSRAGRMIAEEFRRRRSLQSH